MVKKEKPDTITLKAHANILQLYFQSSENGVLECPLCLAELPIELFPIIQSCHHRSCYDCFQQYLKVEISESRVNIACPACSEPLHPNGASQFFLMYNPKSIK